MKQRDPESVTALLRDALAAAEGILRVAAKMTLADYQNDDIRRWAIERQFTIVGEALAKAWKIDRALDQRISSLRNIVDFRNLLAHGYGEIQHHIVWDIITTRVTPLTTEIKAILDARPNGETPA